MALLDFYIRNQKLSKIGPKLVADSINYVDCSFTFKTDDWNGIDKWVVFSKGGESYLVNLVDDSIPEEAGLNLGPGLWFVSLFGESPDGTKRITTNSVTVEVAKSTIQDGEPLPPIALTEAEQIAAKAQRALDTANEVLLKAKNGDFDGKPGEPGKNGENATPEQIEEAVENYFEENPIPGGGNAEVTAESIEKALGYKPADPSAIPTKNSQLENDAEFVDENKLKEYAQPKGSYALKSELPAKTSELENDSEFLTAKDIPVKSVNGKTGAVQLSAFDVGAHPNTWKPTPEEIGAMPDSYSPTYEDVGADEAGKAVEEVGKHNTSENAHNDIRVELTALRNALEAFLDIDDPTFDQLSELIQKIEANAGTITELTNGKVNVADIVNNLTTNVANKPLSAAQGVVLKGLVDNLTTVSNNATTTAGNAATTANEAKSLANTANTNANTAKTTAQNASDKVDGLEQRMNDGEFDGKDGVSIVSVEQTTTSTADGGENVVTVTFSNGVKSTFKIKNGSKGSTGAKGNGIKSAVLNADYTLTLTFDDGTELTTPNIRGAQGPAGKDYVITAADKQEIKSDIISSIITQEAGESESLVMSQKAVTDLVAEALGTGGSTEYETVDSIEEMTDTTKQYVLSTDGFIYAYVTETQIIEHEAPNKFVASEAQINKRMGSSSLSAQNGYVWSNAMAVDLTKESPFRVKVEGTKITEIDGTNASAYQKLWLCADNTGTTKLSAAVLLVGNNSSNYAPLSSDGIIHADYKGGAKLSDSIITGTKYLRIGFKFSDSTIGSASELSGVKITFPSDAYTEEVEVSKWKSTGLKPETGGGGGNYVTLLTKVEKNANDISEVSRRVTALESGSDTVTVPTFWQNAVDTCIAKIKALQKDAGINALTFPFFSDNHTRNGYVGMLIKAVMDECHIPYAFFGGDSIDSGYIADEATMIAQDKAFDTAMSYIPNGRFCRAVGNHDGYWQTSAGVKNYYTRAQIYDLFLREEGVSQEKHFGADGTYYYVDDIASKVRFIVLNTNGGSVDSTQISWLQNMALSFAESGWSVVFISHQPISNHYHANISNAAEVRTIVANYINGSSANKADVVGWFSGHIHRDRIYTGAATNTSDDSEGTAMGFTQVTITSDHTGIAYDDSTKHTVANDDQSHAIDFVTINKATKTVNLTRLGIGEDRSFTY